MDDKSKQNVIINIIDENGKMDKQNESNIDIKDIKSINIDDKELVKIDNIENTENIENKINYDKDFQLNKIIYRINFIPFFNKFLLRIFFIFFLI